MLVTSNFSFSHNVFHTYKSLERRNAALGGNGLRGLWEQEIFVIKYAVWSRPINLSQLAKRHQSCNSQSTLICAFAAVIAADTNFIQLHSASISSRWWIKLPTINEEYYWWKTKKGFYLTAMLNVWKSHEFRRKS